MNILDSKNFIYDYNVQDNNSLYLHMILILFFILFVSLNLATNLEKVEKDTIYMCYMFNENVIFIFLN